MTHSKHTRLSENELTTDALYGATIYGSGDERIGSVSHILGSGPSSQVVVDVGGILGIGARSVALPLSPLEFMRGEDGGIHVVTNLTKSRLEQMVQHVD